MSEQEQPATADGGFWTRLKSGLGKTRNQLADGVGNLLLGGKEIDDDVLAELETALLLTDVGVDATREIMDALTARVKRRELNDTIALHDALADSQAESGSIVLGGEKGEEDAIDQRRGDPGPSS